MEVTIEKLITEILRLMAEESALTDEDKERLYIKVFGSERTGETYDEQ